MKNDITKDSVILQLIGLTFDHVITKGEGEEKELMLYGKRNFQVTHNQICCEWVELVTVNGDLSALEGSPITAATTIFHKEMDSKPEETILTLATAKGAVDFIWHAATVGSCYTETTIQLIEYL